MKKLITICFVLSSFFILSQTKDDTTTVTLPLNVARQILLDLNNLDRQIVLNTEYRKEIGQLNNKVDKLELIIDSWEERHHLNVKIIKNTEQKVTLLEEDNKKLRQEISRVKTKNTFIGIISGAIIGGLTYIILTK
jgi:hypothetical protein